MQNPSPDSSGNPFLFYEKLFDCARRNKTKKIVTNSRFSAPKKNQKKILLKGRLKNGKRPTSHRSTTYLCYVPILEDFAGAGRVGLAGANIQSFCIFANGIEHINYYCILQL